MFHKKLSVFTLLISIIILLSSCDVISNCLEIYQSTKQYNSSNTIYSSELSNSSQNNSQQQNTNGKFDIEEVRKKLWLNGKQFTIPCTAEELGDEYYFDKIIVKVFNDQPDPTYYSASLCSKKLNNFFIDTLLKNTSRDDDLTQRQICGMSVGRGRLASFKVDSIDIYSTKEEVIDCFGNPTEIWGEKTDDIQTYKYIDPTNENNFFSIMFDNNRKDVMDLSFYIME